MSLIGKIEDAIAAKVAEEVAKQIPGITEEVSKALIKEMSAVTENVSVAVINAITAQINEHVGNLANLGSSAVTAVQKILGV